MTGPVRLARTTPGTDRAAPDLDELAAFAGAGAGVPAALAWAVQLGQQVAPPGRGSTLRRWEAFATLGAADLVLARALEPHLDALAILDEAGMVPEPGSTWGVYAAEGPGSRLTATEGPEGWLLEGRKPWCSLAGEVDHALVTAWVDDDRRGLFSVDLRHEGVSVETGTWSPVGLTEIRTTPVGFAGVPTVPVGGPGWYLDRAGFGWGGIGVAAVWYGGAVGLARRVHEQAGRREPDQVALMHLGAIDATLQAARLALVDSATQIDGGHAAGDAGAMLAARVREVVVRTCEEVLWRAGHTLGPGPLSQEPDHARRAADLTLYLRQHHAERDAAALGRQVAAAAEAPW